MFKKLFGLFQKGENTEDLIQRTRNLALTAGINQALIYLRDSGHANEPSAIDYLQGIVWMRHTEISPALLQDPFLDPIWSTCSICNNSWLISPLNSLVPESFASTRTDNGLTCQTCGKTLCPRCSIATPKLQCSCGGRLVILRKPAGRKRTLLPLPNQEAKKQDKEAVVDIPSTELYDLHLYYGFEGRIPIGIDLALPNYQTANVADHLRWAEILLDADQFYQARQQLELLPNEASSLPRTDWLRARLALQSYTNQLERYRRGEDGYRLGRGLSPDVARWLEHARTENPPYGPVWLTSAEVSMGVPNDALIYARRAYELMGNEPHVLFMLGRALYETGQLQQAVSILTRLSGKWAEKAKNILERANLELHIHIEPTDFQALFALGKRYLKEKRYDQARSIFIQLSEQHPEQAEGFYGRAHVTFLDPKISWPGRLAPAYELCKRALELNPRLGVAWQLLGSICGNQHNAKPTGDLFPEPPLDCYRQALDCDPDCDVALWKLAENSIHRSQIRPAFEMLERAASLETEYSSVYFILAAIYKAKHQIEKYTWALNKAKELSPNTNLDSGFESEIIRLCQLEF